MSKIIISTFAIVFSSCSGTFLDPVNFIPSTEKHCWDCEYEQIIKRSDEVITLIFEDPVCDLTIDELNKRIDSKFAELSQTVEINDSLITVSAGCIRLD